MDYVEVHTSSLLLPSSTDGFARISIQFPASKNLCNDLAKASEALDGKKIVLTILLSEQLTRYELRHLPMVPIWQMKLTMMVHQTRVPACLVGRRPAAMTLHRLGQLNLPGKTKQLRMKLPLSVGPKESF